VAFNFQFGHAIGVGWVASWSTRAIVLAGLDLFRLWTQVCRRPKRFLSASYWLSPTITVCHRLL